VNFQQPAAGWTSPPIEGVAGRIATDVIHTVKIQSRNAPRSVQIAPGPSELGTPCLRRLAYKILDWPAKPNSDTDPWTAVIGTSVHAWMAEMFTEANAQAGEQAYLIEHRVHLPYGVSGSCDLYDRSAGTVIDWKITSPQNIARYRRNGPGTQYQTQAHLYALGLQLAGEHPTDVAIVFLPRGGRIDGLHVWSEPYDPSIAVAALRRYDATRTALWTLDPETRPERWSAFPTGDAYCHFCPYYLPYSRDLSEGCPGHKTEPPARSAVDSMIA
jgi:hypothetical protein